MSLKTTTSTNGKRQTKFEFDLRLHGIAVLDRRLQMSTLSIGYKIHRATLSSESTTAMNTIKPACLIAKGDVVVMYRNANCSKWGKVINTAAPLQGERQDRVIRDFVPGVQEHVKFVEEEYLTEKSDQELEGSVKTPPKAKKIRRIIVETPVLVYEQRIVSHFSWYARYQTEDMRWHVVDCAMPVVVSN